MLILWRFDGCDAAFAALRALFCLRCLITIFDAADATFAAPCRAEQRLRLLLDARLLMRYAMLMGVYMPVHCSL